MYHWPCRLLREEERVFRRAAPRSSGERGPQERRRHGGSMDTAVRGDRFREMSNGRAAAAWDLPGRNSGAASETVGRPGASLGKSEFFGADMYMFHVTGFRPGRGVLTEPLRPGRGARLNVWTTDPADRRPVPVPCGA